MNAQTDATSRTLWMDVSATTWCKICGITTLEDALAAANAGVDAIGFNFFSASPRYVEPSCAADLCASVNNVHPGVQRIGLFVDASAETVFQVLDRVELDLLQFHGDESPEYCGQFQRPYIKVLGVNATIDLAGLASSYHDAWGIILDTHDPQLKGGTGRVFDWNLWPRNIDTRLILAGGLDPDNVAKAIEQTRPFGVDVAGGVESGQKGVKDHGKMTIFIEKAKHG